MCPRCGGALQVTDEQGAIAAARAHRPVVRDATRPAPRRPALAWVAHRPPQARPAPPRARRRPLGPTPSYQSIPGWGLIDVPRPVDRLDEMAEVDDSLDRALGMSVYALSAAAVVHAIRYGVVLINRTRPIPQWIDWLTSIAVLVFGLMALVAVVGTFVAFARWVRRRRVTQYAAAGHTDPRRAWWVYVLSVIPAVNAVTAPWLLHEAAVVGRDTPRAARVRTRLAIVWAAVHVLALITVAYRIAAWSTSSVQIDADALALVVATFAASALFARWAAPRLKILSGDDETVDVRPVRRMVAA